MRILITGSRDYNNYDAVEKAIINASAGCDPHEVTIVHGGAKGADKLSGDVAKKYGFNVEVYDADWNAYQGHAGTIRNTIMVKAGADICLAFPWIKSIGTWDCVRKSENAGIPVVIEPIP